MIGYILGAVLLVVIIWGISMYNSFIRTDERVRNATGQIAAQMESRWDALTNLIEATKQYQSYEGSAFQEITAKRTQLKASSSVAEIEEQQNLFQRALTQVNAVAENYPDLKASQVYQTTMNSVNSYEEHVRQARMIYNDTVTSFNRLVKQVPSNLVAGIFGFHAKDYFEHAPEKREMPKW